MHFKQLQTGPLWVNTYILGADGDSRCMVINPGAAAPVLDYLKQAGYTCTHILVTHGHFDHIGGVKQLRDETGAKVCVHRLDAPKLGSNRENLSFLKGMSVETVEPDVILEDGDTFDAAGLSVQVLYTPGHSKGAVCYVIESERAIFCGDTLFSRARAGRISPIARSGSCIIPSLIKSMR